jgi:hypothetical protein
MLFVYWVPYISSRRDGIFTNDTYTSTGERQIHSLHKYHWCGARKNNRKCPSLLSPPFHLSHPPPLSKMCPRFTYEKYGQPVYKT